MSAVIAGCSGRHASSSRDLSPVLEAMGVAPEVGMGAIRFSLGRNTTKEEVAAAIARLASAIASAAR